MNNLKVTVVRADKPHIYTDVTGYMTTRLPNHPDFRRVPSGVTYHQYPWTSAIGFAHITNRKRRLDSR